jgi:hypothetical protein
MRSLRFKHVFATLLFLSFICAFVLPAFDLPMRVTNAVRTNLAVLFWPVSKPSGALAGWAQRKMFPPRPYDDGAPDAAHPRSADQLIQENQELKVKLANLTGRMAQLEQIDKAMATIGDVRDLCKRFNVTGAGSDAALRESLQITGNTMDGVGERMPVLYAGTGGAGIAGTISRAHVAGSVVRLITDRSFRVRIGFARFVKTPDGKTDFVLVATAPVLAEGDGHGAMWIRNLSWQAAKDAELRAGDWVVINDEDWPQILQRYRVGRVTSVEQWSKGPGFAEIRIEPGQNLLLLRDVMVMTRDR